MIESADWSFVMDFLFNHCLFKIIQWKKYKAKYKFELLNQLIGPSLWIFSLIVIYFLKDIISYKWLTEVTIKRFISVLLHEILVCHIQNCNMWFQIPDRVSFTT